MSPRTASPPASTRSSCRRSPARKSTGAKAPSSRPASDAGYLARRLRRQLPEVKIVVGLWSADASNSSARERLLKLGVDEVLTRVSDAANALRQLVDSGTPAQKQEMPKRSARH